MKYWWGYVTAGIFAAITWALMQLGTKFTTLVDMIYPYVTRTAQTMLAQWSGSVDFVLWQVAVLLLGVVALAVVVLMVVLRGNPIRWLGWGLAVVSAVFMCNTLVYGLNHYAGPLADDIRLEVTEYNLDELTEAAIFYRDQANALAQKMARDGNGDVTFDAFDELAKKAEGGFHSLVYDRSFPVFAGTTLPVKQLGWADFFSKRGIVGVTVGLTGESAVNPQIPQVMLPFAISHEMAHRMCISGETDGDFAAFLACTANDNLQYRYSGYFMAYRFCIEALNASSSTQAVAAAARVSSAVNSQLSHDLAVYNRFFSSGEADTESTRQSDMCDLLVAWHIQEVVLPSIRVEDVKFDPLDENQVDLSGIANAHTWG